MSTRGTIRFVVNAHVIEAYNHCDSYPSGLGLDVLRWLRTEVETGTAALAARVDALRLVAPGSEPTDEDVAALAPWYDPHVDGRRDRPSWYQLLHGTQGDPKAILAAGVVEDGSGYGGIEWSYVVDLDDNAFEVHEGGHTLAGSRELDELPTDDEFLASVPS